MIKIEHISVKNYKNIHEADLPLTDFNVIVGPNNSGKSNFLGVLGFLNFIVNGDLNEVEDMFDKAGKDYSTNKYTSEQGINSPNTKIDLQYSNSETGYLFKYSLEIDWGKREKDSRPIINGGSLQLRGADIFSEERGKIIYESFSYKKRNVTGVFKNIFKKEDGKVDFSKEIKVGESLKSLGNTREYISFLRLLALFTHSPKQKNIPFFAFDYLNSIITSPVMYFSNIEFHKPNDQRVRNFGGREIAFDLEKDIQESGLIKNKMYIKALWEILKIQRITVSPRSYKLDITGAQTDYNCTVQQFGNVKFLSELSDGTILLIAFITKLFSSKQDILLIEEPENSIHPKALKDLINLLKSFTEHKQFIIASHSEPIINMIQPEDIIIADIQKDGQAIMSRFDGKELKELRKRLRYISFSDELFYGDAPEDEETTY